MSSVASMTGLKSNQDHFRWVIIDDRRSIPWTLIISDGSSIIIDGSSIISDGSLIIPDDPLAIRLEWDTPLKLNEKGS